MLHNYADAISNAGLIVISLFLRGGCICPGCGVFDGEVNFRIGEIGFFALNFTCS